MIRNKPACIRIKPIQVQVGYFLTNFIFQILNSLELKNYSSMVPEPAQSFLIVETVALRFRPLTMLFT